jgi:hypothetical protein
MKTGLKEEVHENVHRTDLAKDDPVWALQNMVIDFGFQKCPGYPHQLFTIS